MLTPKKSKYRKLYSLRNVPRSLFSEHVSKRQGCGCTPWKPFESCDIGVALYRLKRKEDSIGRGG